MAKMMVKLIGTDSWMRVSIQGVGYDLSPNAEMLVDLGIPECVVEMAPPAPDVPVVEVAEEPKAY